MMNVLGIDGCKFGWIVATLSQKQIEFYLVEHLDKLENFFLNETIVGIDMPVDLITSNSRSADIQARQLLKSRASTIFNAPVIDALYEKNYESASRLNFEKTQKKISKQSWYLFNKIKQIQKFKKEHVGFSFYEVHPELSFMAMNDMRVIVEPKKTPEGQTMRRTMIKSLFPSFNFDLVRQKFNKTDVADDDILDAMAVLWSTQRIVDKMAEFVPKKSSSFEPRIYY